MESKYYICSSLTAKYIAQHHHATPKDEPRKAVDGSQCSVMSLGKISIRKLKEEVDEETYKRFVHSGRFELAAQCSVLQVTVWCSKLQQSNSSYWNA